MNALLISTHLPLELLSSSRRSGRFHTSPSVPPAASLSNGDDGVADLGREQRLRRHRATARVHDPKAESPVLRATDIQSSPERPILLKPKATSGRYIRLTKVKLDLRSHAEARAQTGPITDHGIRAASRPSRGLRSGFIGEPAHPCASDRSTAHTARPTYSQTVQFSSRRNVSFGTFPILRRNVPFGTFPTILRATPDSRRILLLNCTCRSTRCLMP